MKRTYRAALLALIAALWALTGAAAAEGAPHELSMAFGLFSVTLPGGVTAGENTGGVLSELEYELDGMPGIVYANYAPRDTYDATAKRKLDSLLSFAYVLCGDGYTETPVREETLPDGVNLRWQVMSGTDCRALWFEALDERFGYNMCIRADAAAVDDETLCAMMRSLSINQAYERDILDIHQTEEPASTFVSAEHGLMITLSEEWNAVTNRNFMIPGTAFVLERDNALWMIQLFCDHPYEPGDAPALVDWLIDRQGFGDIAQEAYTVELEDLGVEATVVEADAGAHILNVAFVYEGHAYYGLFMWMPAVEAEARPFMLEALRTIAPAP